MPIRKRTEVKRNEGIEVEKGEGIETKHCPFCDNEIRKKAIKCQYCGEWLIDRIENPFIYKRDKVRKKDDEENNNIDHGEDEDGSASNETEDSKKRYQYIIIILVVLFFVLLIFLIFKFNSKTLDEDSEELEHISNNVENNNTEIKNDDSIIDYNIVQGIEDFLKAELNNRVNDEKEEKEIEIVVPTVLGNNELSDKPSSQDQTNKSNSKNQNNKKTCSAYPGTVYRSQDGWCACPGDPVGTSSWNSRTRSCSKNKTNNSNSQQSTNLQQNTNNINCNDSSIIIACSLGGDACPAKCKTQISSSTKNEVNQELSDLLQENGY